MLLAIGALCFIYYVIICLYLKKWNSTFSRFWLAAGILLPVFWFFDQWSGTLPVFQWGTAVVCGCMLLTFFRIFAGFSKENCQKYDYLIVLGAQVRGTKITDSLRRRLEAALCFGEKHPEAKIIVSGGQGKGEDIAEARAMAEYLCSHGIAKNRIMVEDQSRTTQENLRFSAQFLDKEKDIVGIVSNNFHLYRACSYARRQGYRNACPVAASCHPVLFVNYMVREVFAVWKLWLQG